MSGVPKVTDERGRILIQDPPIARTLFQSAGVMSVVWLVVRVFVAYQWLDAFWEKFQSSAWMGPSGSAILGFWKSAVAVPANGRAPITYDWYRSFLEFLIASNAAPWFSKVIVFGELTVGIALLLGAFVGIAATGGLMMNMAFMLAGSASTNPVLAVLSILLILAWKNAGFIGLDRWLLPMVGTPWEQERLEAQPVPAQTRPMRKTA